MIDPRSLPLPPEDIQKRSTARAGEDTLLQAEHVYRACRRIYGKHGSRDLSDATVLDFGCGWGRVFRFFLGDVAPERLWGVDPNAQAIDLCRSLLPGGNFVQTDPHPPCPLDADTFDLIFSWSVFSHLAEEIHWAWLREFDRILRAGGILIASTRPRWFFDFCDQQRRSGNPPADLEAAFVETEEWIARYDRGEFCFDSSPERYGTEGARLYGETCIPERYVRSRWAELFEVLEYVDDELPQSVIVCRKRTPR